MFHPIENMSDFALATDGSTFPAKREVNVRRCIYFIADPDCAK